MIAHGNLGAIRSAFNHHPSSCTITATFEFERWYPGGIYIFSKGVCIFYKLLRTSGFMQMMLGDDDDNVDVDDVRCGTATSRWTAVFETFVCAHILFPMFNSL